MRKLLIALVSLLCAGCFWGCKDEPSEPWHPDFKSIVTAEYFRVSPHPLQIEDGKITLTVSGEIPLAAVTYLKTLVVDVRIGLRGGYLTQMKWHEETNSFRGENAPGDDPPFPHDGLLSLEKIFTDLPAPAEIPTEVWVDLAFHYQGRDTQFQLRIDDGRP